MPTPPRVWRLGPRAAVLLDRPVIVAILNVTPDSFADGGRYPTPAAAADAAAAFVEQGAHVIDVGGESTRPGAALVSEGEQIDRTVPVIRSIRALSGSAGQIPISIDTTRAAVAAAALDAGADAINDVSAGTDDPGMLKLAAARRAGIVLMHRLARPRDDRYSDRYDQPPPYDDVVATVRDFLAARAAAAVEAGVAQDAIVLDPGLGFGKAVEQNIELIRRTPELAALGYPILSGLSRKSFVGRVWFGRDSQPAERLTGTLLLSALHFLHGARVFRVHDVADHVRALAAASLGNPAPSP